MQHISSDAQHFTNIPTTESSTYLLLLVAAVTNISPPYSLHGKEHRAPGFGVHMNFAMKLLIFQSLLFCSCKILRLGTVLSSIVVFAVLTGHLCNHCINLVCLKYCVTSITNILFIHMLATLSVAYAFS